MHRSGFHGDGNIPVDDYFLTNQIFEKNPPHTSQHFQKEPERRRRSPKTVDEAIRRVRIWFWTKCFVPLTIFLSVFVATLLFSLSYYENYKDISIEYDAHEGFLTKSGTCPGNTLKMFTENSAAHASARDIWGRISIKKVEVNGVPTNCHEAAIFCSKSVAMSALTRTIEESYWYQLLTPHPLAIGVGVLFISCFSIWAVISHYYSFKVDARIVDGINRAENIKAQM